VNRIAAALLAIIGGAAIALGALMIGTAGVTGILWIFVFGDDEWPAWVMNTLNFLFPIVGLFLWAVFGWQIWLRLKRML
jgi:hypothetical protein